MSAELDFLAELERDLPADVKAQFDAAELKVEAEENENIRRDLAEALGELYKELHARRRRPRDVAGGASLGEGAAQAATRRHRSARGPREGGEPGTRCCESLELCTGGRRRVRGREPVKKDAEKKYGHEESKSEKADDLTPRTAC